jgi:histidine ammonia-lyase
MPQPPRTIDDVLAQARAGLRRLSPEETAAAVRRGALLVDIRPDAQRVAEGAIPGALVIERNVLEWRLDPVSAARIPAAVDHDVEVVVFCSEGYTSSLAASSLQDLGLRNATDLDGGFQAWMRAGLPVSVPAENVVRISGSAVPEDPQRLQPTTAAEAGAGTVVIDPETALGIEGLLQVANGGAVALSPGAHDRLRRAREVVRDTLAAEVPAYGLNGGLGHARDQRISAQTLARYQVAIVLGHAGGIGPPLPTAAVRAAMLARLNSAARGGSALTEATAEMFVKLLNAGVHPVVPAVGSVGASDLMHLAAVASVAIGYGQAEYGGRLLSGADALEAAGLEPLQLEPGEGLALVSANSVATGCGCLAVQRAQQLVEEADVVAALSLEAVNGNLSVVDPAVGIAKPVPGQIESIRHLRSILGGSRLFETGRAASLQDALSFRVIPQVHGAARELVGAARQAVEIELNAMDDNPLVWIPDGRLISNGNFQPVAMALCFDALRPALAHVGLCSIRRMNHLGMALFGGAEHLETLIADLPKDAGRGLSTYAAAALWAELRQLAGPATLDIQSLDLEHEDHATAAPLAVATTDRALGLVERILAVELDCASSVIALRRAPRGLGAGSGAAFELARAVAEDSQASAARVNDELVELLRTGELLRRAHSAAAS